MPRLTPGPPALVRERAVASEPPLARGANSEQNLSGERGVSINPQLLGEVRPGPARFTANAGVAVREDARVFDAKLVVRSTANEPGSSANPRAT